MGREGNTSHNLALDWSASFLPMKKKILVHFDVIAAKPIDILIDAVLLNHQLLIYCWKFSFSGKLQKPTPSNELACD